MKRADLTEAVRLAKEWDILLSLGDGAAYPAEFLLDHLVAIGGRDEATKALWDLVVKHTNGRFGVVGKRLKELGLDVE